jgi:hypothetical protein
VNATSSSTSWHLQISYRHSRLSLGSHFLYVPTGTFPSNAERRRGKGLNSAKGTKAEASPSISHVLLLQLKLGYFEIGLLQNWFPTSLHIGLAWKSSVIETLITLRNAHHPRDRLHSPFEKTHLLLAGLMVYSNSHKISRFTKSCEINTPFTRQVRYNCSIVEASRRRIFRK